MRFYVTPILFRGSVLQNSLAILNPRLSFRNRRSSFFHRLNRRRRWFPKQTYFLCGIGGFVVIGLSICEGVSAETMSPLELPGRPGNLTDEQKVKLKEMWTTAFKVFGIPLTTETQNKNENENEKEQLNDVVRTDSGVSEVKDKKGGKVSNLFKKKKDKDKAGSQASSSTDIPTDLSKLSISDGDDKYSQTKEFKEAIATSTPEEIRETFWKMVKADHPDSLFLRFLRARKWDVNKAIVMLVATMHWRSKEINVSTFLHVIFNVGRRAREERRIAFGGDRGQ
jgi:CRAL/TRIO, N-terminal domain